MGEVEGVGELVTGAALAAAVEPMAGGQADRRDEACLNCSTPLAGAYCSACGQKARVHRSLRTFFGDLIQGLFNFEGKIWRTLPLLAWKPGEMTRRYVEGERARFVSPVALYLFTVFAMFAVLNFTGTMDPGAGVGGLNNPIEIAAREKRGELATLEGQRKEALSKGKDTTAIDQQIASTKEELAPLENLKRGELVRVNDNEMNEAPPLVRDTVAKIQADPQATVLKVQDAASKFSWLLIPLSVPFLWLLFPFSRRYHLYDHTVFVTYSLSFMMMLVIAAGLLVAAGLTSIASLLFFVPPIHMYRQLRGAYQLGRTNALFRTLVLVIFSFITSTLFFVTIFAIGIL